MRVREVMTHAPLWWCEPEETAQTAAALMKEHGVGMVLVLRDADSRQLLGVVTDRDICTRVVARGLDPRFESVADVMTEDVITCAPTDSIDRVLTLMKRNHVRRLPVLGAGDRLVGVVSTDDLVCKSAAPAEKLLAAFRKIFEPEKPERTKVTAA